MTKIFQTFGTGWYFGSAETFFVTTPFGVVVVPADGCDFLFFFFLAKKQNTRVRIIARIHKAIKPKIIIFFEDQPKIINKYIIDLLCYKKRKKNLVMILILFDLYMILYSMHY